MAIIKLILYSPDDHWRTLPVNDLRFRSRNTVEKLLSMHDSKGDVYSKMQEGAFTLPDIQLSAAQEETVDRLYLQYLTVAGSFESETRAQLRRRYVDMIELKLSNWVFDVYGAMFPESMVGYDPAAQVIRSDRLVRLIQFGSYFLGVNDASGDIDSVCIFPQFVDTEAFFSSFPLVLRQVPQVTYIQSIPHAASPILTFTVDSIDIDIAPCVLDVGRVTDAINILNNDLLQNISVAAVRALNGCRTNLMIRTLVQDHLQLFQDVLRGLKLFTKRRHFNSNKAGTFGGINNAILLCHLFVRYYRGAGSVADISRARWLYTFLSAYAAFDWTNKVVQIDEALLKSLFPAAFKPLPAHLHNVQSGKPELMRIITLSMPTMNSCMKVFESTRDYIVAQFEGGRDALQTLFACVRIGDLPLDKLVGRLGKVFDKEASYVECFRSTDVDKMRAISAHARQAILRPALFEKMFEESAPAFFASEKYKNNFLTLHICADTGALEGYDLEFLLSGIESRVIQICWDIMQLKEKRQGSSACVSSILPHPVWYGEEALKIEDRKIHRMYFIGLNVSMGSYDLLSQELRRILDRYSETISSSLRISETACRANVTFEFMILRKKTLPPGIRPRKSMKAKNVESQ